MPVQCCSDTSAVVYKVHCQSQCHLIRAAVTCRVHLLQDAYMPKDASKLGHRGIGFVTFASPDSVEKVLPACDACHCLTCVVLHSPRLEFN